MSPRPRIASDVEIVEAATRAVGLVGSSRLTLADIAAEAGISPGALVQRFGSKRDLVLQVIRWRIETAERRYTVLTREHPPIKAIVALLGGNNRTPQIAEERLQVLAWAWSDPTDADLNALVIQFLATEAATLRGLIESAQLRGDIAATVDRRALATRLQDLATGTAVNASLRRPFQSHAGPTLASAVKRGIEQLLSDACMACITAEESSAA